MRGGGGQFPGGGVAPHAGIEHKPTDWRNCRHEWVQQMYTYDHGCDAALAINEGSQPPHYYSGPLWAIFDQDAVERAEWELRFPYVADNGYYFKADTIEDLAAKIEKGHKFQRVPLKHLADDRRAVERLRRRRQGSRLRARRPTRRCTASRRPPFHALAIMVIWHDSYGGLRVNGKHQVVDMRGEVIPGLYAGGEAVGGFQKHGLGKGPRAWLHRGHECRRREAVA